jgi:hypothetical protein
VINNDGSHGDATSDTNVNFSAAGLYPIEITYFNGDWTSDNSADGSAAGVNHSGNPDPGAHGGANFHLRVNGADITSAQAAMLHPALITTVVETGGVNEPTDTIAAKWTGQTFVNGVANEPLLNTPIDAAFTAGWFGNGTPAFVDRAHVYTNATSTATIPSYLLGGEIIMSGNDNRDRTNYVLDVTVSVPVQVYLLIDNRLGDPNSPNTTPPQFGPTKMKWVLDQGWTAVKTGVNRTADATLPDEVGFDEAADGTINQYYSIYTKSFPAGTFQLKQADNAGQNMYGVVVTPQTTSGGAPKVEIAKEAGKIVVRFPAGSRLQRTSTITVAGSWTDVTGTSPFTVQAGPAVEFFRAVSP